MKTVADVFPQNGALYRQMIGKRIGKKTCGNPVFPRDPKFLRRYWSAKFDFVHCE